MPKRKKKSTALARRPTVTVAKRRTPVVTATAELLDQRTVTDGIALGSLGLVELKLTDREEAILSEPIDRSKVLWRPRKKDGPADIPYLPHAEYTRWLNRAFTRTGWALVPVGKPAVTPGARDSQQTITCPYILYIHGKPVAFAMGEQEYYSSNESQTYGDALESTVASALRRCAKRLGIGLELWDRNFITPPSPAKGGQAQAPARQPGYQSTSTKKITDGQRRRFWVICKNSGRMEDEIKAFLKNWYGLDSSKDIQQKDYDAICQAIESPAALPAKPR